MTDILDEYIRSTFSHAVIIDDDFSFIDTKLNENQIAEIVIPYDHANDAYEDNEIGSGNVVESPEDISQSDSNMNGFDSDKYLKLIESFYNANIVPIPFLYSEKSKAMLKHVLSLSRLFIIDYTIPGFEFGAIDIIENSINKFVINPVIIFTKKIDNAIKGFSDKNDLYIPYTTSKKTPCFRRRESGIFILIYSKEDFNPTEAMDEVIEYVKINFETYSILAMKYYEEMRTKLHAIHDFSTNDIDSSIIIHACGNNYLDGDIDVFIIDILSKSVSGEMVLSSEKVFLERLHLKSDIILSLTEDAIINKLKLTLSSQLNSECCNFISENFDLNYNIKNIFIKIKESDTLTKFISNLNKESKRLINKMLNEYYETKANENIENLKNRIGKDNFPSNDDIIKYLKEKTIKIEQFNRQNKYKSDILVHEFSQAIIHVLLANDVSSRISPRFLASLVKYRQLDTLIDEHLLEINQINNDTFNLLVNGDILHNPNKKIKVQIGNDIYEGEEIRYCITPSCDLYRPKKVGWKIKFILGCRFTENYIDQIKQSELTLKDSIRHIQYVDNNNHNFLVRLNFGHVESIPIKIIDEMDNTSRDEKIKTIWNDWRHILRLRSEYAHNILNAYIAYQSRSGTEDIQW